MSKKLTINDAGDAVVIAEAELSDIVMTAISTKTVLTGAYALGQRALLVGIGMAGQQYRVNGSFNFLRV